MTRTESDAVATPNSPSPQNSSTESGSHASDDATLNALAAKIEAAKADAAPKNVKPPHGAEIGFQMALELLSGVAVGGFGGYQLDVWLGTKPWLMLVCLLFGLGVGMITMLRTAKRYY